MDALRAERAALERDARELRREAEARNSSGSGGGGAGGGGAWGSPGDDMLAQQVEVGIIMARIIRFF